jgi:hypothetical protein
MRRTASCSSSCRRARPAHSSNYAPHLSHSGSSDPSNRVGHIMRTEALDFTRCFRPWPQVHLGVRHTRRRTPCGSRSTTRPVAAAHTNRSGWTSMVPAVCGRQAFRCLERSGRMSTYDSWVTPRRKGEIPNDIPTSLTSAVVADTGAKVAKDQARARLAAAVWQRSRSTLSPRGHEALRHLPNHGRKVGSCRWVADRRTERPMFR